MTTPPPGGGRPVPEPAELAKAPAVLRDQVAFDFDEVSLRGRINFGSFPDLAVVQSYSGDVERWVVSTFSQVAHPFHIHQGQFVIEKIEYYSDQALTQLRTDLPQNPLVNDVPRELDTFAFPGRSKAYIKLRTSRFVGKFVMHCHLLLHEDDGMMLAVRVVPPRSEVLTAVGARRGELPTVSLAHAVTGETVGSFMPYGRAYRGGVGAAVGNVLGDGRAHVVTIPLSGSPLVRVFERTQLQRPRLELRPFDGSGDGGSVAVGDIDGDGVPEILVGSGKGRKPMVAVYRLEVAPDGSPKARLMFEVPVLDDGYRSAGCAWRRPTWTATTGTTSSSPTGPARPTGLWSGAARRCRRAPRPRMRSSSTLRASSPARRVSTSPRMCWAVALPRTRRSRWSA